MSEINQSNVKKILKDWLDETEKEDKAYLEKATPKQFTKEELRDISCCVGWTLATAYKSPEGEHRLEVGLKADEAFRRVFGPGYHVEFLK